MSFPQRLSFKVLRPVYTHTTRGAQSPSVTYGALVISGSLTLLGLFVSLVYKSSRFTSSQFSGTCLLSKKALISAAWAAALRLLTRAASLAAS